MKFHRSLLCGLLAVVLLCALVGCQRSPRYTFLLNHDGTALWRGNLDTGEISLAIPGNGQIRFITVPDSAKQ